MRDVLDLSAQEFVAASAVCDARAGDTAPLRRLVTGGDDDTARVALEILAELDVAQLVGLTLDALRAQVPSPASGPPAPAPVPGPSARHPAMLRAQTARLQARALHALAQATRRDVVACRAA